MELSELLKQYDFFCDERRNLLYTFRISPELLDLGRERLIMGDVMYGRDWLKRGLSGNRKALREELADALIYEFFISLLNDKRPE